MVGGDLFMRDANNEIQEILIPGFHGENCSYNGTNIDFEIACDECDFFLTCFPDWEMADSAEYLKTTIKTAPDSALKAFLQANAFRTDLTDNDMEIKLQIAKELHDRKNRL